MLVVIWYKGLGDDHYFYITPVWWLSGLLMSGIFLYGSHVSGSLWGGTSKCFVYIGFVIWKKCVFLTLSNIAFINMN